MLRFVKGLILNFVFDSKALGTRQSRLSATYIKVIISFNFLYGPYKKNV